MKKFYRFVGSTFLAGLLIVVPLYLSVLLALKAMQSVVGLVRPFARLLPEWLPAENLLSFLLVLIVCFFIGIAIRTPPGRAVRERIEKSLFERMPGYALIRSLTQRLAGKDEPADEPFVGSGDIHSLADLGNSFEVVRTMQIAPITRDAIVRLGPRHWCRSCRCYSP